MIHRRSVLALLASAGFCAHAFAEVAPQRSEIRDSLSKRFVDDGTSGTFVAYDVDDYFIVASDRVRSGEALLPASTFKIANSLIALETGVVDDPDKDVFKWDGTNYPLKEWNRDHTLRSAIAASVVPVYQEIARRIGTERMQKYVDLLQYGNRDISGGIDQFWLKGGLRIDPMQQVDFVDRLRRGVLSISARSQNLVRDIMPTMKADDAVIRAKTGLVTVDDPAAPGGSRPVIGWLVGWTEKGPQKKQTVFALNMDIREPRHVASRMTIARQLLADVGAI